MGVEPGVEPLGALGEAPEHDEEKNHLGHQRQHGADHAESEIEKAKGEQNGPELGAGSTCEFCHGRHYAKMRVKRFLNPLVKKN